MSEIICFFFSFLDDATVSLLDANDTSRKLFYEKLQSIWCNYASYPLTGCKNCTNVAPDVFAIEEDFGRARVYSQCGNPELIQQAVDSWYVYVLHSGHLYLSIVSMIIIKYKRSLIIKHASTLTITGLL